MLRQLLMEVELEPRVLIEFYLRQPMEAEHDIDQLLISVIIERVLNHPLG